MVPAQCKDMHNQISTLLTQTVSSTMENTGLNISKAYYMLKLDPVTGKQTLTDTLTDEACTNVLPKMDISFPYQFSPSKSF
jgi:hypothetical protein